MPVTLCSNFYTCIDYYMCRLSLYISALWSFYFPYFPYINVCVVWLFVNNIYYDSNSDVLLKSRRKNWMLSSEVSVGCELTRSFEDWMLLWNCSGTEYLFFFSYLYLTFYDLAEKFIICINTPFHDRCKKIEPNKWNVTNKKTCTGRSLCAVVL